MYFFLKYANTQTENFKKLYTYLKYLSDFAPEMNFCPTNKIFPIFEWMKKYPIGIQDFRELRTGGFMYVDKTYPIFHLIERGKYFFLSRPRRFGKSLLLSTLKYYFKADRQLFEGLWIADKIPEEPSPVLHFSFSTLGYKSIGLEDALYQAIDLQAASFGLKLTRKGIGPRFQELMQLLGSGAQKVVLLIDEYDKPLVDYIDQTEKAEENREILKSFFSVIKDSDPFLRFFLITGVSKFSKVSLFSDLNHLRDITLADDFATLTGYTQQELNHYFRDEVEQLAQTRGESAAQLYDQIKLWYNGYSWDSPDRLYNPFSILNFFASGKFHNYWWDTGTPTFLIKQLRKGFHYDLEGLEAGHDVFESYTLENLEWQSLLFQTGYLTIKDYDEELRLYTLGYPNLEVKDAMFRHLLGAFREGGTAASQALYANIKRALDAYDMPRLIDLIDTLFSTIPYQLFNEKQEKFFHAVLHLTFQGLGLLTQSEVSTAKGRVDTIVHSKSHIYIMEFKLDDSTASALAQISERQYGHPYLNQEKEVIALGVSFSSESRTVAEWQAVPYSELEIPLS